MRNVSMAGRVVLLGVICAGAGWLFSTLAPAQPKAEERVAPAGKPALEFVRKSFDETPAGQTKQFVVAELLRNDKDGQYILFGTISSPDGGTAGVKGRLQAGEFLITKSGTQLDIANLAMWTYPGTGQGFNPDQDQGTITASWGGSRHVKLLLWRCNE